jgi:hypothetical protein
MLWHYNDHIKIPTWINIEMTIIVTEKVVSGDYEVQVYQYLGGRISKKLGSSDRFEAFLNVRIIFGITRCMHQQFCTLLYSHSHSFTVEISLSL